MDTKPQNAKPVKVVLECAWLTGLEPDSTLQRVATVFVGTREFKLYVPGIAKGDPRDWFDQAFVRTQTLDGSELGVVEPTASVVKKKVGEELSKFLETHKSKPPNVSMRYHVKIIPVEGRYPESSVDMDRDALEKRFLQRYEAGEPIVVGGRTLLPDQIQRILIFETAVDGATARPVSSEEWFTLPNTKNVTDHYITTPKIIGAVGSIDPLDKVLSRFHAVCRQLRKRHNNRGTLDVQDEYDVQDLLHSLLVVFFMDIRPEEWTPSYAGKSARMDFLLYKEEVVIEAKKTRSGLTGKEIGDELAIDIMRYKAHPRCKRLVCFVYDPDSYVSNPVGLENDLTGMHDGLSVKVMIVPH